MLEKNQKIKAAQALSAILEAVRAGEIPNPTSLKSALIARMVRPFGIVLQQTYFDFLYGALQLMILARDTNESQAYEELFQLAVSHIYSLVSIGATDLPYQVEHFLAHAAVYLSLNDSNDVDVNELLNEQKKNENINYEHTD